ncbi:MAG TPA: hypothetical protein VIL46_16450 [Gemmataceae bacterium]
MLLAIVGYLVTGVLFVIGAFGLLTGHVPFFTRRPTPGWGVRAAALALAAPLPVAVWLGTRPTPSDAAIDQIRQVDERQQAALPESLADGEAPKLAKDAEAARRQARERFDELERYEHFFDCLFFAVLAVLIATTLIPSTSPQSPRPAADDESAPAQSDDPKEGSRP